MELNSRGPFLELSMRAPFPGVLLGVNRYLRGPETVMTLNSQRALKGGEGWIVLTGKQGTKTVEVAILPHGHREGLLTALRGAGVRVEEGHDLHPGQVAAR